MAGAALAGFISLLLYGLIGINYSRDGMTIHPCIPREFENVAVKDLKYQNAQYNIKVSGWGTEYQMYVDGTRCESVSKSLKGRHAIELIPIHRDSSAFD